MPFLSFDLDALKRVPDAARAAGLSEPELGYGLLRMWGYCWTEKVDHVEEAHLQGFFGGDGPRVTKALGAFRFLEPADEGFRVRGTGRYLRLSRAQSKGGKTASGNLKRGQVRAGGVPESVPGSSRERAGEQPGNLPGSLPGLTPSTEHRAPIKELQQPHAREAPKQKPSEPPTDLLPDQIEAAAEIWRALESERADRFGLAPKADPPETCRPDLLKFSAAHKGNVRWALDTQAQWFERADSYVGGLDRKGKTEVLLKPSQWPNFQGPEPGAAEPEPPPLGPCCECGDEADRLFHEKPFCASCLAEYLPPSPWDAPKRKPETARAARGDA